MLQSDLNLGLSYVETNAILVVNTLLLHGLLDHIDLSQWLTQAEIHPVHFGGSCVSLSTKSHVEDLRKVNSRRRWSKGQ